MARGEHTENHPNRRVDRGSFYSSKSEPTLNPTRDYRVLTSEQQEQKKREAQGQHEAERRTQASEPRKKYYDY